MYTYTVMSLSVLQGHKIISIPLLHISNVHLAFQPPLPESQLLTTGVPLEYTSYFQIHGSRKTLDILKV